tara:strand:- start:114 stop:734 length:621 start_codon:yes stop_codon:yes gene_type:complete
MIRYKQLLEKLEEKESHTTVIPLVGFSPFSHMGHAVDLGSTMASLPKGKRVVGMSTKSGAFTPEERTDIMKRQWSKHVPDLEVHPSTSAGETVAHAFKQLPKGKRHLHLLVGADRKAFAEGLKQSLESNKIPEMVGQRFDSVTIHHPEDIDRQHGMSGTKMRTAASTGDIDEFHKHIGPAFTRREAVGLMGRVKSGIQSGKIKVKR